jgi:hypothetical protein
MGALDGREQVRSYGAMAGRMTKASFASAACYTFAVTIQFQGVRNLSGVRNLRFRKSDAAWVIVAAIRVAGESPKAKLLEACQRLRFGTPAPRVAGKDDQGRNWPS